MGDTKEKTLDDIVEACHERYGLNVTEDNKGKYIAFLERQLEAHSDYDLNKQSLTGSKIAVYPYLKLLLNKLMLFSYLVGESPIIVKYKGLTEEKRIESVNDLYLLRWISQRSRINLKMYLKDRNLISLYESFRQLNSKYLNFHFPNWCMTIDELGKDREVIAHLGREISYDDVSKCPYPNHN